jgi:hemoglobin/transferrin/lactoferrin receptor protein
VGASLEVDKAFEAGGLSHHLTYGGDVSKTRQEGVRTGTTPPAGETYPTRAFPNTDYVLAGVYVQDEIGLADGRLRLYPALRYDVYDLDPEADASLPAFAPTSQNDSRLSPKLAATWKVGDGVILFANYAQGFKAPAPSQVNSAFVNLAQNYRSIPNPDLKPETSETLEGGLRLRGDVTGGWWSAEVTAFAGEYQNFIDQVQVSGTFTAADPGVFQVVNLSDVKISGAEARGRLAFDSGWQAQAALSYAHGAVTSRGVRSPLDSIDPIKLVAGVGYRDPARRFGGDLTATHSDRKSASRVASTCTGGCFRPDSFTVLDLTAWWAVSDRVRVNAGVFNLTDQTYFWWSDVRGLSASSSVLDAYSQPGRNVAISLTLKL